MHQLPCVLLLKLRRRQVSKCRVQSAHVVNLVDERRDTFNDICKIPIFTEIAVLALERAHKAQPWHWRRRERWSNRSNVPASWFGILARWRTFGPLSATHNRIAGETVGVRPAVPGVALFSRGHSPS
jgi:hypothetical protein